MQLDNGLAGRNRIKHRVCETKTMHLPPAPTSGRQSPCTNTAVLDGVVHIIQHALSQQAHVT
eukprot:7767946-Pyramimonas_sp.AAC.1